MASEQDHRKPFLSLTELAVVVGIISILIAVLIPAVNRAREAARRTQSRNNLRQVALGLHNYLDSFKVFPPGGVFNAEGVGFHEWTTMIAPYLHASGWYIWIDFNRPWDDPQQVAFFRNRHQDQFGIWANPSLPVPVRPDGLVLNHYAGSETVFFRNSSVSLSQIENLAQRMLVADAYAQFLPVGAPFGWRDVTLGLARDSGGFGCSEREITQCVMADGSVRELPQSTADAVLRTMC
jgi:type II secretory pathway pseudopilin PulG